MAIKFPTIPPKRLAQGILSTSNSFKLTEIKAWNGEDLVEADFGDNAWAIFRNENGTVIEIMQIDPATIADDSIDILARGLAFDGSVTSDAARKLNWPSFETIVQIGTDAPQMFQELKDYIDGVAVAGSPNASLTAKGLVESATTSEINAGTAQGSTAADLSIRPDQLAASIYGTRLPTSDEKTNLPIIGTLTGAVIPYAGKTAPTGWLVCDGSAISRTTYATLKEIICPSAVATITIATPAVVTSTTHGLVAGDKIHFTTTGSLPTGISTNTDYYVLATDLTANTFKFSLSPGGTVVDTSGTQSGIHTLHKSSFGKGDGSTTFNIPDLRSRFILGISSTAPTMTLDFQPGAVSTGDDQVTILDEAFPAQGQKIQLTTTGTLPAGLSLATDYWIIRASSTTIKFASSAANAVAGTAVNITDTGSGVHTLTYTQRTHTRLGFAGGEHEHMLDIGEIPAHTHSNAPGDGVASGGGASARNNTGTSGSTGGNEYHNNLPPYVVLSYIIKT